MTKFFFLALLAIGGLSLSSCKKDKKSNDNGYDKKVYGNHPRTENVPASLAGRWQYGVFSMTQYDSYTGGGYSGNAVELSNTYQLNADGTAIEFFYCANRGYYSVTEVLGKRFGTFTVNEQKPHHYILCSHRQLLPDIHLKRRLTTERSRYRI